MSPLGRHIFIAQGGMRAKPEMKPWVSTDKSEMSSFRSGTNPRKQMPQRINTLRRKKTRTATTQTKCALLVPPLRGSKMYINT